MTFRFARWSGTMLALALAASAWGATVGDIQVVYFAPNTFGVPSNLDAPAFIFENTTGTAITNATFSILSGTPDTFNIGTIAANSNFVLELGVTTDGGSTHTFFAPVPGGLDTSDTGPDADTTQFQFLGLQGVAVVDSGIFTPATSRRQSNDNTVSINFLGLDDGPCGNCFGPAVVATLSSAAVRTTVPEPATMLLLGMGLAGLAMVRRRRK